MADEWVPRPTTRWWLEGDHAGLLCLVSESGLPDDPPCPVPRPVRADWVKGETSDWLSPHVAVGVTTAWLDGAHGWIEAKVLRRERPDETKARKERAKARSRGDQGVLL